MGGKFHAETYAGDSKSPNNAEGHAFASVVSYTALTCTVQYADLIYSWGSSDRRYFESDL